MLQHSDFEFGLYQLSVRELSRFVASDLSPNGPTADALERQLIQSIDDRSLPSKRVRRDLLSDAVDAELTFLDVHDAFRWFEIRGFEPDRILSDYMSAEIACEEYLRDSLIAVREIKKRKGQDAADTYVLRASRSLRREDAEFSSDILDLQNQLRCAFVLVAELEKELLGKPFRSTTDKEEKPLTATSKRSHQRIIAALCKAAGIDWKSRGAATQIQRLVDEVGSTITDDTVRPILAQIGESL